MTKLSTYVTTRDGSWMARLVYIEDGRRQERQRTLGLVHAGRGRPRVGAIPERVAWDRANELAAQLEHELGYDVAQREARAEVTFRSLALAWLADAGRSTGQPWTPATTRDYRSVLGQTENGGDGHILPTLGDLSLNALTTRAARAWWDGLSGLQPRNANKQLTVVRRIIAWATEDGRWGKIDDPTVGIRKRADEKVADEAPRFFELAELDRILTAARDLHEREAANPVRRGRLHVSGYDADIFELLAHTGIRRGEVLALRVGDVDLDEPVLTIRSAMSAGEDSTPKSKRARRIPLTDRAVEILSPLVEGRDDAELVFAGGGGGGLDADALSRRFLRARDHAKLKATGLTIHDLRHTTGSLLVRHGFPLTEVQAVLGHAKLATTARYLHHRPRAGDADRMSRAFTGKSDVKPLRQVA
jgi:integrase